MSYNDEQKKKFYRTIQNRPRLPRQRVFPQLNLLQAALPVKEQEVVHWELLFAWEKLFEQQERFEDLLLELRRRISDLHGLPASFPEHPVLWAYEEEEDDQMYTF